MRRPKIDPVLIFIAAAVLFWLIEGTAGAFVWRERPKPAGPEVDNAR